MRRTQFALSRISLSAVAVLAMLTVADALAVTRNGFVLDDASVPTKQILSGGPGKDGIPSLDRPRFIQQDKAKFLQAKDRVLGLVLHGVARAYPVSILNYHEIVNDSIGGRAIVVTFCPLCGSGMAFFAQVDDRQLIFGVSGLLYNSDVLLYDRQTDSLWSQLKSEAISGPMKGTRLEKIAVSHTSWRDWRERHPDSLVLSADTGFRRNYRVNPYPNYGRDGKLYFPVASESGLYRRKTLVMGLEIDRHFKAYPFPELKRGPDRFSDKFQDTPIEVEYDHKNQTARVLDAQGREIPTVVAFWFAWYSFHPDTAIYTTP